MRGRRGERSSFRPTRGRALRRISCRPTSASTSFALESQPWIGRATVLAARNALPARLLRSATRRRRRWCKRHSRGRSRSVAHRGRRIAAFEHAPSAATRERNRTLGQRAVELLCLCSTSTIESRLPIGAEAAMTCALAATCVCQQVTEATVISVVSTVLGALARRACWRDSHRQRGSSRFSWYSH